MLGVSKGTIVSTAELARLDFHVCSTSGRAGLQLVYMAYGIAIPILLIGHVHGFVRCPPPRLHVAGERSPGKGTVLQRSHLRVRFFLCQDFAVHSLFSENAVSICTVEKLDMSVRYLWR